MNKKNDNKPCHVLGVIAFKNGILEIPNLKNVKGNLHERINERHKIVMLRDFMRYHPMNGSNYV